MTLFYWPKLIPLLLLVSFFSSTTYIVVTEASTLVQREKELAKNPENIKLRTQVAKKYYKQKNYNKVIQLLDPYSADLSAYGFSILANSFQKNKDYQNESRILNLLLASVPTKVSLHLRLGRSYVEQNLLSKAVEHYRLAIKLNPQTEKAYLGLLDIFKKQNNNYESQIIVKDMIKRFGIKPLFHSELCRIYTEEAYVQQAIDMCKEAITDDPKNPDNHANLAQSYIDKGEPKAAENILKTATKRFKKSERLYYMLGHFYFLEKNYSVATRYFSGAVLIDKESFRSQLGMARSSFLLGKFEQSLMGFENSCKINSKDTLKHFKEAVTKLRLDKMHRWEQKFNASLFRCMQ